MQGSNLRPPAYGAQAERRSDQSLWTSDWCTVVDFYLDAVALATNCFEPNDYDATSSQLHRAYADWGKGSSGGMPDDSGLGNRAACLGHLADSIRPADVTPKRCWEPARAARVAFAEDESRHELSRTAALTLEPKRYVTMP